MNEWILNSSLPARVAEILRRACKSHSTILNGGRSAIARQRLRVLTISGNKHKKVTLFVGREAIT